MPAIGVMMGVDVYRNTQLKFSLLMGIETEQ